MDGLVDGQSDGQVAEQVLMSAGLDWCRCLTRCFSGVGGPTNGRQAGQQMDRQALVVLMCSPGGTHLVGCLGRECLDWWTLLPLFLPAQTAILLPSKPAFSSSRQLADHEAERHVSDGP